MEAMMLRKGLLIAAGVFLLDQAVKLTFLFGFGWIKSLKGEEIPPIDILPFFQTVMVWNKGISYGLLQASSEFERWLLVAFSLGVTAILIAWLRTIREPLMAGAIGLIVGGALGNVVDRVAYGAVADFFHLHAFGYSWYVFNVADTAIVVGVALMALDLVLGEWRARTRGATEDHT